MGRDDELIERLEAMRNEPDAWGEPEPATKAVRRKSEQRQRALVISVRFSPSELAAVQERAHMRGQSVSTFLRSTALSQHVSEPQPQAHEFVQSSVVVNAPATEERSLVRETQELGYFGIWINPGQVASP
jgi:hypothetical protein